MYKRQGATNKNVTWSSSNPGVATVANGVVTAIAGGSATITVTTEEGEFSASCIVEVTTKENNGDNGGGDEEENGCLLYTSRCV